jgi:hypothetical protein
VQVSLLTKLHDVTQQKTKQSVVVERSLKIILLMVYNNNGDMSENNTVQLNFKLCYAKYTESN